ncbi:RHS repeat-associated core domain-containing protein, partial [Pseudoduganella plicata]
PRELTDSDGRVVWAAQYRAWGNVLRVVDEEVATTPAAGDAQLLDDAQPIRFQGQYFDNETGLHYNRFRYYDPDIGRFISIDPLGLAGAANTFGYAINPVQWVDPLGLSPCRPSLGLSYDKSTRTWTTPAGLAYGVGSVHGNRIRHILDHAAPNLSKTNHSVFNVDRREVLGLVDEAWRTRTNPLPNDPGAYVIPMGRAIGTAGESSIKIIVRPGTNKVITAYPIF